MTKVANNWIKKIEPILQEELSLRLKGWIPPFDFLLFSNTLSRALSLDGLSLASGLAEWKVSDHVLMGLGTSAKVYAFESPLIKGPLFWIMGERDVERVVSWLEPEGYMPKELVKGVYEYALLEGVDALRALSSFLPFSCRLGHHRLPETEPLYCVDISLQYREEVLWGRLALSKESLSSMEKHFANEDITVQSLTAFPDLPLTLHLSAGSVQLTEEEYKSLSPGDFVVLDHPFFRPKTHKGSFQLRLQNTPLFQVKIKEDQMKILDFSYDTEEAPMDDSDNLFEEEEPLLEDEPEMNVEQLKLQDVPLTLHVELKRIKMTLSELHALLPGQSIPLTTATPTNAVYLTLEGHRVAEGELIEIADNVIGIKLGKIYR